MKWEYKFIQDIIESSETSKTFFLESVKKKTALQDTKGEKLPSTLMKFYAPTIENIQDVKNKRIWMSSPDMFNDPFDCSIGYNQDEYKKYKLIKYILQKNTTSNKTDKDSFTKTDLCQIYNTYTVQPPHNVYTNKEDFSTVFRRILESKSKEFQEYYNAIINSEINAINNIIKETKHRSVRITCFTTLTRLENSEKQMLLWSHYADSHRGFCVEYDISSLRNNAKNEVGCHKINTDLKRYIKKRVNTFLEVGLFPVSYSNKRIMISKTLLNSLISNSNKNTLENSKYKEAIIKSFITKSTVWSYEKEWRLIVDDEICEYYKNKIPFPFIKSIIIGLKASKKLTKRLYDIAKLLDVEVYKIKETDENYDLLHCFVKHEVDCNNNNLHNPFQSDL